MERIGNGVPVDQAAIALTVTKEERQQADESKASSTANASEVTRGIGVAALIEDDYLAKGWQDLANCLGVDPDLFFPERGASTREAKEVCKGCTVREECLEYSLATGEKFGIWGGLSERERRRLRRQRAIERRRGLAPENKPNDG